MIRCLLILKNNEIMTSNFLKSALILFFLSLSFFGNAQLIDPFGKVITHEIKLNKLDDGTYMGAMEWTTGGLDSLQRFVVNGLDVKAPVLVRIISKAPDHNIDLSFHKKNWNKVESKVSTNGKKFADKVFRTMNIAGLGVRSKVAGIPYLITVKVGLQFPYTKSLIRITDDKEEYSRHLRKMGFSGAVFPDDDTSSSNASGNSDTGSNQSNNTLIYIVIGLLSIIVILLVMFLIKKKSSKNTILLLLVFCSVQFCMAQTSQPTLVPVDGQGNSPVFYQYQNQNVGNQTPVTGSAKGPDKSGRIYTPSNIETGAGVKELTGEEAAEINRRIEDANDQFDKDFGVNSPGKKTQGNQRTLPTDKTNAELKKLRKQVRKLQQKVDLLAESDEEYDEDNNGDGSNDNDSDGSNNSEGGGYDGGVGEILLYCEDIEACQSCLNVSMDSFNAHVAYWNYLQKFYLKEVDDLNDKIEYGNTLASMPHFGIAWGPILTTVIRPAMNNLKEAYNKKFNEYIYSIEKDIEDMSACYQGPNGRFRANESYEIQAYAILNSLKAARINK